MNISIFIFLIYLSLTQSVTINVNDVGSFVDSPNPSIQGSVSFTFTGTNVILDYRLTGVSVECENPDPNTANSCGVHIHSASDCSTGSAAGGHYYNTATITEDPWKTVVYNTNPGTTMATGTTNNINWGYEYDVALGVALVVHNYDGSRATCAFIGGKPTTIEIPELGAFDDAPNPSIQGKASLEFIGEYVRINYDVTGVSPDCANPDANTSNSCGIHIHSASNCSTGSAAGPHYYNPALINSDPWSPIAYISTVGQTTATGSTVVYWGYGFDKALGVDFVLHNYDGSKATCTFIGGQPHRVTLSDVGSFSDNANPSINGSVDLEFVGNFVRINYNLNGVETLCETANSNTPNSCGIHIHSGTDCSTGSAAGGHYYNPNVLSEDPWKPIVYSTNTGTTTAIGSTAVDWGYTYDVALGVAFVIHGYDGSRKTCAFIGGQPEKFVLSDVGAFEDNPNPSINGSVELAFFGDLVRINYNLTGVPTECENANENTANSCGIHIHSASDCSTGSAAGGHYYNPNVVSEDPWKTIVYTTNTGLTTATGSTSVVWGYTFDVALGVAFVIHGYDGSRQTCAFIGGKPNVVSISSVGNFEDAPNPSIQGSVNLEFIGEYLRIDYHLTGVSSQCENPNPNTPNSCGIHIHSEPNCSTGSASGGHYYNKNIISSDPWSPVSYITDTGLTTANGKTALYWGFPYNVAYGVAFVVHNYDGSRATCAYIVDKPTVIALDSIGSFTDQPNPSIIGSVQLEFIGYYIRMNYNLSGVSAECANPNPNTPNSCGIHIHAGKDCSTGSAAGGHLYNNSIVTSDPWSPIAYKTDIGQSTALGTTFLEWGYNYSESIGVAFVVHNYDGSRATCTLIDATQVVTTTNPLPYSWHMSEWNPINCPTECEVCESTRTRTVYCVDNTTGNTVNDNLCTTTKPTLSDICPATGSCSDINVSVSMNPIFDDIQPACNGDADICNELFGNGFQCNIMVPMILDSKLELNVYVSQLCCHTCGVNINTSLNSGNNDTSSSLGAEEIIVIVVICILLGPCLVWGICYLAKLKHENIVNIYQPFTEDKVDTKIKKLSIHTQNFIEEKDEKKVESQLSPVENEQQVFWEEIKLGGQNNDVEKDIYHESEKREPVEKIL